MESKKVLLRRKNKIVLEGKIKEASKNSTKLVLTFVENIKPLGFIISEELFNNLIKMDEQEIINMHSWVIDELKARVGTNVEYMPMYPNFPKQVMQTSELKLYLDALFHYWERDVHNELAIDIEEKPQTRAKEIKNKKEIKEAKYTTLELGKIEVILR